MASHPTVGVARFGPKVSDRLSSLSEEQGLGWKKITRIFVLGLLAYTSAGQVARTNFFQILYRVRF